VGHSKGWAKGKIYTYSAYIKKMETSQINHLLEKQEKKPNPKPAEGEK
jgi:hypothetical protein